MIGYKYSRCGELCNYNGWDIVKIIESTKESLNDMVVISRKNNPIKKSVELDEATNEQLIEELIKRLGLMKKC